MRRLSISTLSYSSQLRTCPPEQAPASGRGAYLRQHLADRIHRSGDAALAELPHAADTKCLQRRQLARVQHVAARLDGVVEGLEGVLRAVGCVERHDDRRLNRRR